MTLALIFVFITLNFRFRKVL